MSKSLKKLASALADMGHSVSPNTVRKLLTGELGFSRQSNRKADEGTNHPDRNAQFEYINAEVLAARAAGEPVISVDTQRKELVGNYRNGGDWRPKGEPLRVNVHDFPDKQLGKVAPCGVYDIAANAGWVSLGHHTRYRRVRGGEHSHLARQDRPGTLSERARDHDHGRLRLSNGSRVRLWKVELQNLADETNLTIKVRHYPPGTSKMEQNRASPVLSHHAELARPAAHGPCHDHRSDRVDFDQDRTKVEAVLDTTVHEKGIKITDDEMKRLNIHGDTFHPEWNYTVIPRPK